MGTLLRVNSTQDINDQFLIILILNRTIQTMPQLHRTRLSVYRSVKCKWATFFALGNENPSNASVKKAAVPLPNRIPCAVLFALFFVMFLLLVANFSSYPCRPQILVQCGPPEGTQMSRSRRRSGQGPRNRHPTTIRDPRSTANECACDDLATVACLVKAAMTFQPRAREAPCLLSQRSQSKSRSKPKMPRVLSIKSFSQPQKPQAPTGWLGLHITSWVLPSMSCSSTQTQQITMPTPSLNSRVRPQGIPPPKHSRAPMAASWLPWVHSLETSVRGSPEHSRSLACPGSDCPPCAP